ncbi:hypothetical protein PLUA15_440036 [Pseudomonas lundensis]|uniref:Uncharacterized protein n=1 Tax=Pseudomonas lundensis TaxID=86185 RepID=A0AAX2HA97_9PSED|nr:hypothetical protein PLUA15_440036 [Pseudomonas lundensis]
MGTEWALARVVVLPALLLVQFRYLFAGLCTKLRQLFTCFR